MGSFPGQVVRLGYLWSRHIAPRLSKMAILPSDDYRLVTIFCPCPEVVIISDNQCIVILPDRQVEISFYEGEFNLLQAVADTEAYSITLGPDRRRHQRGTTSLRWMRTTISPTRTPTIPPGHRQVPIRDLSILNKKIQNSQ